MRKFSFLAPIGLFTILVLSSTLLGQHQETPSSFGLPPILGFTTAHAMAEHKLETEFQSIPSPEKVRES
ncbi:MAG TPA: hypothetical protein VNB49_15490, partial [Candidatus Dormibacteraeota bacterium]|nr:hypothetical protein [Candidatus Dormibacteraeota bacterium]